MPNKLALCVARRTKRAYRYDSFAIVLLMVTAKMNAIITIRMSNSTPPMALSEPIDVYKRQGLTNARIEAINNKIKLSIRMAYGFRNLDNMMAMIMLRLSLIHICDDILYGKYTS